MALEGDPGKAIEDAIKNFIKESEENRLGIDGGPIWEEPLVGFANGKDPLFEEYKKIIGPFHLTPEEFLAEAAGASFGNTPDQKVSVICWVLPMASRIRAGNRRRDLAPTMRYVHATGSGEILNESLRDYVVSLLTQEGYLAVAPSQTDRFKAMYSSTSVTSNWSERHALYVAGMGTFGLNGCLITAKGAAMRCGSVVTNLQLPPSPRLYKGYADNCPFLVNGSCGDCIDRCPAGAITVKGLDKIKCKQYKTEVLPSVCKFYESHANPKYFGCGLCQCGVPCESRIPSSKAV